MRRAQRLPWGNRVTFMNSTCTTRRSNWRPHVSTFPEKCCDGLWDIEVAAGDPANPNNTIWWSSQMRRLLGCNTVEEFPNTLKLDLALASRR